MSEPLQPEITQLQKFELEPPKSDHTQAVPPEIRFGSVLRSRSLDYRAPGPDVRLDAELIQRLDQIAEQQETALRQLDRSTQRQVVKILDMVLVLTALVLVFVLK